MQLTKLANVHRPTEQMLETRQLLKAIINVCKCNTKGAKTRNVVAIANVL